MSDHNHVSSVQGSNREPKGEYGGREETILLK